MKNSGLMTLFISVVFLGGCAQYTPKKELSNRYTKTIQNSNAVSYNMYPTNRTSQNIIYPKNNGFSKLKKYRNSLDNGNYQRTIYNSKRPVIARGMQELDNISANTKPTYIRSIPQSNLSANVQAINLEPIKYKLISYVNSIRANGGVCSEPSSPLGWSNQLYTAASSHARDMSANNFVGHLGSGSIYDIAKKAPGVGSNFYERILFAGYPIKPKELAGEILTYTKDNIVGSKDPYEHFVHAVQNFLKSPRHCSVLNNNRFKDMGISGYRANDRIYWVIEFAESGNA